MVQVDVVGGCSAGVESYGFADHEGDGLGLRLLDYLGGGGAAFGLMQHLVGEFMD